MPNPPTLKSYSRDSTSGTAIVSADPDLTIHVYGITYAKTSPEVLHLGSASSTGGDTEVSLDLSQATWNFFGVIIDSPCVIFAVTEDANGNYSAPSNIALPSFNLGTTADISVEYVTRGEGSITVSVSGLNSAGGVLYLFWTGLTEFKIQMHEVRQDGEVTLEGDIYPHVSYFVVACYFTPEISLGGIFSVYVPPIKSYYQIVRRSELGRFVIPKLP